MMTFRLGGAVREGRRARLTPATLRETTRVVRGVETRDGAGVRLTRLIGADPADVDADCDPFLLFDAFGSDEPADYVGGFPDHPHRGFETVTYMLNGRMRHEDNLGNRGILEAGSVQWMTAGRGVVHSETPQQQDGLMRGFQLWVNLPAAQKMRDPRYQNIPPPDVPRVSPAPGVQARVIAGEFGGVVGPVRDVATAPAFIDLGFCDGAGVEYYPAPGSAAFVHVFEGESIIVGAGSRIKRGELGWLGREGDLIRLEATEGAARALVVAAQPIGEPVARYGPFVMNTAEEIRQAFADYRAGRF